MKESIRTCIENHQQGLIDTLESELAAKREASDIDENDVRDADAQSHQSQAAPERQRLSDRLKKAQSELSHLKRIPLTSTNKVEEGALIETRSLLIYVGIVTQKFIENGRDIIGISTEAPIYKELEGKGLGYPFKFAGIDCSIISIS